MSDESTPARGQEGQPEGADRLSAVDDAREQIAEDAELQTALQEASTEAPPWPGQGASGQDESEEPDPTGQGG
ncbi:hypothetical protein [Oryzihumus sp.]|jgi:hypothetical protein|uniref:hypothetical protein n=1 Tax=Oryzihumus sp. TaxID=1968903 RepID=UPI002ED7A384